MGKGRSKIKKRRKVQSSKPPRKRIYLVFLALMVIIPYARTINFDFVTIDDAVFINAIAAYNRSIRLNPGQGAYFMNRLLALNASGNQAAALKDAQRAQQLGFNVNPGYINQLKQQDNE